jgi:hypothetical protein
MMGNGALLKLSRGSGYRSFGLQDVGAGADTDVAGLRMTSFGVARKGAVVVPSLVEVE